MVQNVSILGMYKKYTLSIIKPIFRSIWGGAKPFNSKIDVIWGMKWEINALSKKLHSWKFSERCKYFKLIFY